MGLNKTESQLSETPTPTEDTEEQEEPKKNTEERAQEIAIKMLADKNLWEKTGITKPTEVELTKLIKGALEENNPITLEPLTEEEIQDAVLILENQDGTLRIFAVSKSEAEELFKPRTADDPIHGEEWNTDTEIKTGRNPLTGKDIEHMFSDGKYMSAEDFKTEHQVSTTPLTVEQLAQHIEEFYTSNPIEVPTHRTNGRPTYPRQNAFRL